MSGLGVPSSYSASPTSKTRADMANTLVKAKSASHLPKVAILSTPSRGRSHLDSDLNTLPDPRTPSPAPRTSSSESRHPDLSNEVAMLSTKLINAINHQTNLDDTLQQTRHELEATKRKLAESEARCERYSRMITTGILVKKADADTSVNKMKGELSEAQKQRDTAEKGRKDMEVELENLTSALFEEANTMVSAARKESEAIERKNAQLRSQLNDTELLLASQQEQLADLKNVMERMTSEQDETDTLPRSSTAPSTPGHDTANKMSHMFDTMPMSPNTPAFNEYPPDQPLRFSHLITPIMRSDVQAYIDFVDLLKTSRAAAPSHSRDSSGVGFSNGSNASNSSASMVSSSPNVPGSFSSSITSSPRESSYTSSLPPLKDHKFYKRCLVEDIEPALRLDLAPGLSWLARRTVISAITAGSLVVEPFIPQSKFYGNVFACSLCGESRRTEAHARRHRFRTSEDDSAQRYPLCEYCLGRIRSTCDFLGFLRMVRDGLWRARTDEDITGAWEESVRLREKMFWCRLGGGVVPAPSARTESPAAPQRRLPGTLLRRTSSNFSTMTKRSVDEGASNSIDVKGLAVEVPKLHDLPGSRLREQSASAEDAVDGSESQDFASTQTVNLEAPPTPTHDVPTQAPPDLDGSSTKKPEMGIAEASGPPPSNGNETEVDDIPDSVSGSADEPARSSAIPGSFE